MILRGIRLYIAFPFAGNIAEHETSSMEKPAYPLEYKLCTNCAFGADVRPGTRDELSRMTIAGVLRRCLRLPVLTATAVR